MRNKLFCTLLLSGLLICFVSCKKDSADANPDSYLKFKKNGTWVTYSHALGELGPDLYNSAKTDFGVSAFSDDMTEIFDFTIQIDGSNFTTGTYSSDNYPTHYVNFSFITGANTSNMHNFEIDDGLANETSKYIIRVTSITPTHLTGTFTGNYLYDNFADDSGILRITEGEFNVKRIR